MSINNKQEQ